MRSLQRSMCAAILALEAVVMLLTTPVMVSLADVRWEFAVAVGGGLTLACLVVAGALRGPAAYLAGWAIQAAAIALGFVIPVMFGLGAIFLGLWATAYYLGRRIDREKAAQVGQK